MRNIGLNSGKDYLDELTEDVLVVQIFLDVDLQWGAKAGVQEELCCTVSVVLYVLRCFMMRRRS